MKTNVVVATLLAAFGIAALSAGETTDPSTLIAHEWGTFTAVIGSDGMEIPWWTPILEGPAALPEFVRPPAGRIVVAGKSGVGANPTLIRMETPVIYFYSDQPATLDVSVDTAQVRLTEVFPATVTTKSPAPKEKRWNVRIAPPGDTIGGLLPPVGERGAHYAHARAVPSAWWVVSEDESETPQVEKFIFYRGTGDLRMPKRIYGVSDKGPILIPGDAPLFLIEVDPSGLHWKRINSTEDENPGSLEISRPLLDEASCHDTDLLVSELIAHLSSSGLSHAEATAMVKTWHDAWLGEPGLRLLEILPRSWVDEVLPLAITPKPAQLERVFVARWEMITPETETKVLDVLELTTTPESKAEALRKLGLKRFGGAAFERAAQIRDARFRANYQQVMFSAWKPAP